MRKTGKNVTWFTARVLFRAEFKGKRPRKKQHFEESWLLVSAVNQRQAMEKARKLAKDRKLSYANIYGDQVSWRFVKLLELQEILDKGLGDGVEVYSKSFRRIN